MSLKKVKAYVNTENNKKHVQVCFMLLAASLPKKDASRFLLFYFRRLRLSPLGTAATTGLLYQLQMIVEQLVE
jgi:hypothetical protein